MLNKRRVTVIRYLRELFSEALPRLEKKAKGMDQTPTAPIPRIAGPLRYLFVSVALLMLPVHMQSQVITGLIRNIDLYNPTPVVVNPVTNKIYVSSDVGLKVIDGSTGTVTFVSTISFGSSDVLAVNTLTNKIYGFGPQGISVFDGSTNAFTAIPTGISENATYRSIAINPATNKIYEVNPDANNVTVLDGQTNLVSTIPVGPYPTALAVNPNTNKIYVSSGQSNNVTVIDGLFNTTTTVPVGILTGAVAVDSITNQVYFNQYANGTTGGLVKLDGNTNTASLPSGILPLPGLSINPLTNKLYLFGGLTVEVVDAATGLTDQLSITGLPIHQFAINTASNKIYVCYAGGPLAVIDGNTDILTTINTPLAELVTVNPITNRTYVGTVPYQGTVPSVGSDCDRFDVCNSLYVIDGSTPITASVAVGAAPTAIAINSATNKSYVLSPTGNSVTAIDGVTLHTASIPVGVNPTAVAANPITNKTYIANAGSNSVSVLDGSTNTSLTVPVSTQPGAISVNPVTNKVYVANPTALVKQITILDGATNTASTLSLGAGLFPSQDIAVNAATDKIYVETADGVTVVDGATQTFTTIPLSIGNLTMGALAVNPVTNKIYVSANAGIAVLDGATNNYLNVTVSGVGKLLFIQVNSITNKIYVAGTGTSIAVIDGASNTPTYVAATAAPSGLVVNPVTNKIYALTGSTLTVIDGIFNSTSTGPLSAAGTGLTVNPNTDQIYVSLGASNSVAVISNQQPQPNPLTVNITALAGNQTSSATPSFTFTAQSTTISPPTAVYYQVDTQQSAWTAATGSNPTFTATLATLLPGVHTLYAYTADSQASTLMQPYTPVVGTVQAYTFLVTPPSTNTGGGGNGGNTVSSTSLVTGQTPGALRNNYSGFVGFAFTVGSSALQVTSLGRFTAPGNTGTHLLKLVMSSGNDVSGGSASVTMSGAAVGQYQYGTLSSPVTLVANTSYYLVSAETAGGDQWYDIGGVTSTSDAIVTAPVYSYGSSSYYAVPGLTGKAYVPVNFQFTATTAVTPPVTPPVTTSGTSFVTAQTPGALRNNYSGFVGFSFTVGSSALQVSSLGRLVAPGNAGTHLLKLVMSSGTDVSGGSASVTMSGATVGQYQYGTLSSPITLAANTSYYLVSAETAGGDQWYDIGGVTSTSDASVTAPVYSYGSNSYYPVPGFSGKAYVPVNFQYQTSATTPVTPPASTGTALFTGQTPGALRNNYSGFVGTALQVGATPLTVSSLGRFFAAGNNGSHTLKLVQANGVDVAGGSVSVTLAGGTAGQYSYAALAAPVTLQANTTYYLLSQETSGGDFWFDLGPVTATGAVQVAGAVYSYGTTNYALAPGTAGYSYGPLNLLYQ